jgi:hypothetical protein
MAFVKSPIPKFFGASSLTKVPLWTLLVSALLTTKLCQCSQAAQSSRKSRLSFSPLQQKGSCNPRTVLAKHRSVSFGTASIQPLCFSIVSPMNFELQEMVLLSFVNTWTVNKIYRFVTYCIVHNSGHYSWSYLLFKTRRSGDWILSPPGGRNQLDPTE